jgi:hypothetical protein
MAKFSFDKLAEVFQEYILKLVAAVFNIKAFFNNVSAMINGEEGTDEYIPIDPIGEDEA